MWTIRDFTRWIASTPRTFHRLLTRWRTRRSARKCAASGHLKGQVVMTDGRRELPLRHGAPRLCCADLLLQVAARAQIEAVYGQKEGIDNWITESSWPLLLLAAVVAKHKFHLSPFCVFVSTTA
mgnify:CR=1 FL=1